MIGGATRALAVLAVHAGACAAACARDDAPHTVRTWSGQTIAAETLSIDPVSLTVESGGVQRVLGWHDVRAVEGPASGQAGDGLDLGRVVWRAGARLARGDSFGAEPLFERAFERTRGSAGVTPAFVADGLLRCRLRRDARAAAIDAWLELAANLSVAPARTPSWGLSSPAVDPRTRLVPSLPPFWFDSAPTRAFASAVLPDPADDADPYAAAIRSLYRQAALSALGDPVDITGAARAAELVSARPGGALVADAVLAQIGGEATRAAARASLAREQSLGNERWRAVWASLAIGRSLVREPDDELVREGILELLAVHAIDADALPYVTAIALADAALAAESVGDTRAASAIRADLRREFPEHPVLEIPGLAARAIHALPDRSPGANL